MILNPLSISISPRTLHFRQPAGTSRGVYTERLAWFVTATDGHHSGVGECAPLPQLSCDDLPDYELLLRRFCDDVERTGAIDYEALRPYPSMLFGLETALLALRNERLEMRNERLEMRDERYDYLQGEQGNHISHLSPLTSHLSPLTSHFSSLFDTPFSRGEVGIPINGLVWMGNYDEMNRRIEEKIEQGFHCVKLKIGAIDFDSELALIRKIRQRFSHRDIELRVDANGAFSPDEALYKLELLSQYALHSIEQPVKVGQWAVMAELCRESPLPIALDEELIGITDPDHKRQMLNIIRPAYIVLKPSLHGGMAGTREWVDIARDMQIGSWITSALESNVGLNAIAQLTADIYGPRIRMAQGLGTGQLYTDNIPMPLEIRGEQLWTVRE